MYVVAVIGEGQKTMEKAASGGEEWLCTRYTQEVFLIVTEMGSEI
jgi:hypothetical protein